VGAIISVSPIIQAVKPSDLLQPPQNVIVKFINTTNLKFSLAIDDISYFVLPLLILGLLPTQRLKTAL
jgi:hypothetical protein